MAQQQSQSPLPFGAPAGSSLASGQVLLRRALPADPGVWDELRAPDGALRPAWQRFADALPAPPAGVDPAADLDQRAAQVAERIRLDGVTHNVFGPDGVAARPWSLELLPLPIEPAEWAGIEQGVIQRAALLEAMLVDCYGPQRLLHEGLLPPELLLRHPGYLRPLHGVAPPGGQRLYIVAFDIARGPDGRWWMVAQRTHGPSGLGYVLHNRSIIASQFPEAFRELRVQHLASSYRRLLDALEAAARDLAGGSTPRLVLLTPGPYSETYFEQAFLARYLGVPLVEGGDLTVRGDRLFLKTVEGLEPVHGLLRRLDDDYCDPLELRPDSALGVPGLLQTVRAGTVVMANALGSGFLESPALQGFLPGIAQCLTGDGDLVLPSLPTWWCGEPAAWADVRDTLDDKLIRGTYPHGGRTSQVHEPAGPPQGRIPEGAARRYSSERASATVDLDPAAWTVQGRLRLARAPIWGDGVAVPRPAMVRVYALASAPGRWHVLPGGMTRVSQREDASLSMQRGGSSLDTWVMTDGPVDTYSMLPGRLQVDDILRRRSPVSSRTGENLFWLGRYTERTEQLVRLARATLQLIGADSEAAAPVLQALSTLGVRSGLAPSGVPTLLQSPALFERAVLAGLRDARGAFSVAFDLQALEQASQALRERLSPEQWGLIRSMRESFAAALAVPGDGLPGAGQAMAALDRLALQLAAATGGQTDRMTRDPGWRLLAVGRLLERLIGLTTRLEVFLASGALAHADGVDLLLELFDSAITFRARYQRHGDLLALADLLVLDDTNPRAFAGVLRRLRTELGKLPGTRESLAPLLARLPATGAGLTLESLRGADEGAIAQRLRELSDQLGRVAWSLADDIGHRYFTLAAGQDELQHV